MSFTEELSCAGKNISQFTTGIDVEHTDRLCPAETVAQTLAARAHKCSTRRAGTVTMPGMVLFDLGSSRGANERSVDTSRYWVAKIM
jgi:hypothetical protein